MKKCEPHEPRLLPRPLALLRRRRPLRRGVVRHRPARPHRAGGAERHGKIDLAAHPGGGARARRRNAGLPPRVAHRLPAAGRLVLAGGDHRRGGALLGPGAGRAGGAARRHRGGARRGRHRRGAAGALRGAGRAARRARPLRGAVRAPPGRADPGGAGIRRRPARPPHPDPVRRLADAGRAGRAPPPGSRSPAPRRAHQPPRRPHAGLVRGLPARDAQGHDARLPRPALPQPADRPGALARAGGREELGRRLRRLPPAPRRGGGAARRQGGAHRRPARPALPLHRALRRQEHQGHAGQEQAEDARPHGDGGAARGAGHGALPLPRRAPLRARGAAPGRPLPVLRPGRPSTGTSTPRCSAASASR